MTKFPIATPVAALVLAAVSTASPAQAPDEAEMQRLMEQARQAQQGRQMPDAAQLESMQQQAVRMQSCMENVDQQALQQMQVEGERVGREIRALCDAGERDAAQRQAMAYGRRVAASPEIAEIRKCGEHMGGMVAALTATLGDIGEVEDEAAATHACDVDVEPR